MKKKKSALVLFSANFPWHTKSWWRGFEVVIAPKELEHKIKERGINFLCLEEFIEPGSIYEASTLLEELSYLKLATGSRITIVAIYQGYELWWIHYDNLFHYFCLPYTQYKKLLKYLSNFQNVSLYDVPFKGLFSCYLKAYKSRINIVKKFTIKSPSFFPLGIFFQILITSLSLPILIIKRKPIMVFTGDKFEKFKDYDFRMSFIYSELRKRNIFFVEFIRSLETWQKVLYHAFIRRRLVIYPESITFVGRFISFITGGRRRANHEFGFQSFSDEEDPEIKFKLLVATQYLLGLYDDIWAIKITKIILNIIGVKVSFITAAVERNFHAVIGCKLNEIPIIGILHGVASCYYNGYEFLPGFDGKKSLSVDKYGVWSKWWRDYFLTHGKAYKAEQIEVSGPMRPVFPISDISFDYKKEAKDITRVLFISEEVAVPQEVLPYLNELLKCRNIDLTIKFRPYRDGFENWLLKNEPNILKSNHLKIVKNNMQEAIKDCDVTVGSYSTAVLEAFAQLKVPIFFRTQKWGDYYDIKEYNKENSFFAENPQELISKIKKTHFISLITLKNLRERYFGDPSLNGSKWVVDQMEYYLR